MNQDHNPNVDAMIQRATDNFARGMADITWSFNELAAAIRMMNTNGDPMPTIYQNTLDKITPTNP